MLQTVTNINPKLKESFTTVFFVKYSNGEQKKSWEQNLYAVSLMQGPDNNSYTVYISNLWKNQCMQLQGG